MAITAGSVSIGVDGTETKSGWAERVYDIIKSGLTSLGPTASGDAMVAQRKAWAVLANAIAQGSALELTTNAKAQITTGDSGLQRNPENSADCLAPSGTKLLSIV